MAVGRAREKEKNNKIKSEDKKNWKSRSEKEADCASIDHGAVMDKQE